MFLLKESCHEKVFFVGTLKCVESCELLEGHDMELFRAVFEI